MMEKTTVRHAELSDHLDVAMAALRYVAGERGEVRVTMLLDDPDIERLGPFDQVRTMVLDDRRDDCISVVTVGKRQRGIVDLTVAGFAMSATDDTIEDVPPHK